MDTRPTRGPARRRVPPVVRALGVLGLLYLFLVGVSLLESGIAALGSDVQDRLFDRVGNPLAGLFVGLLATVVVQSSSVTTATIVGLVASGVIGVDDAVPMVMGANIGTTITNTLASLGHVRRSNEFKRAFAAATMHDVFNILSVAVLLPFEIVTGAVSGSATWLSERLVGQGGTTFQSPIKEAVKGPIGFVEAQLADVGLHDVALGVVLLLVGLGAIFVALAVITRNMRALVADRVEAAINRVLSQGSGMVAILIGIVITVAVQSSSITTSILIPLCASGVLTLGNAFPVTLGANVGTTITALLASLATGRPEALTVALAHTLFNVFGIALLYPYRPLRRLPVTLAERLATLVVARRALAGAYIIGVFVVVPLGGTLALG